MAEAATTASNASTAAASDPYVIYQLRKPSQRGTAVIPRFVPNTHAPAFSPANYRFARVWANDSNAPPNSLLQVPRSFEYAGSLGSESSFWSDTSSWVSVSSLRTAQSDQRQPLLHSASPAKVSAAAFFAKEYPGTANPLRSTSNRSSEVSHRTAFRYPPALSESISEDAVVDDLLGARDSRFPLVSGPDPAHRLHVRPSHDHHSRAPRHASRAVPRSGLLPALTRKRRNLWQWLFCSDQVAASTVASVTGPPPPPKSKGRAVDRVPGGDKEFFSRKTKGRDHQKSRSRAPSFELRRGRPERETPRRTASWNFVPKGLLGRDQRRRKPPSTKPVPRENVMKEDIVKRTQKKKDRPRAYVEENESRGYKFGFAKATVSRTEPPHTREKARGEEEQRRRPQEKSRQDRPREDRPRKSGKAHTRDSSSVAPVQKSVVPSLREKGGGSSFQPLMQRMRSADSSDPVTSRISSDLSSTLERSLGSRSGNSTPVELKKCKGGSDGLEPSAHVLDPAANGVSSDVSSHASGVHGKHSPDSQIPTSDETEPPAGLGGIDFSTINAARASRTPHLRSGLFAFPSSSTESSGILGQNGGRPWEMTQNYKSSNVEEDLYGIDNYIGETDSAIGAGQNLASSLGDPLSYLMTKERDIDADTQSTGLTSLADESVSTHKTVSGVPDDFRIIPSTNGAPRYQNTDPKVSARQMHEHRDDLSDSSGSAHQQPHIFRNSALFSRNQPMSPSHLSSASPRRFHSDWSDPHATDIDVFCQCNCSCVYEEECRRSCDLVYGRSPSVSSTRSCSRRSGFQSLPPGVTSSGQKSWRPSEDSRSGDERSGHGGSRNSDYGGNERTRTQVEQKYGRASAGNRQPDPRPYRGHSTSSAYSPDPFSYQPYSAKSQQKHRDEGQTGRNSRTQQFDDRPREDHGNHNRERGSSSSNHRQSGREAHASRSRAREVENGKSVRRYDASSPYRSSHQAEGRNGTREQRSRTSSRTTTSSRHSSGPHGENGRNSSGHRTGSRESLQEGVMSERKSKRADERRAVGSSGPKYGGAQQMGNSFVVRRNGPPPFIQANTQQYKTAEDARNRISHREIEGKPRDATKRRSRDINSGRHQMIPPETYGSRPKVEKEHETRRVSSPEMYRNNISRTRERTLVQRPGEVAAREETDVSRRRRPEGRGQSSRKPGASGHGQRIKTEARPSSRQSKSTTRQGPRNGTHGRSPLFGIF